ncbi:MAG: hypothetical protein ABIQ09_19855 [Jatrophihabitantaceae bacterium]
MAVLAVLLPGAAASDLGAEAGPRGAGEPAKAPPTDEAVLGEPAGTTPLDAGGPAGTTPLDAGGPAEKLAVTEPVEGAETEADTDSAETEAASAETESAAETAADDGVAIRRATAAVRLATRPTWRRTAPDATDVDGPTGCPASAVVAAIEVVRRRVELAGAPPADTPPRRGAGSCSGCARRIANARRSAVTGPGADSGDVGTALPVPDTGRAAAGGTGWLLRLDAGGCGTL